MEQGIRVVSIRIPDEMAEAIQKIADAEYRTFASAVRALLAKALELKS